LKTLKKKEHEKLDPANIDRVIGLLNDKESPINKKQACTILNITYNTTRLNSIIQDHLDRKERRKKAFERNRGIPLADHEVSSIVMGYLQGSPISELSEQLHRPTSAIKAVIDSVGVPERPKGDDAHKVTLLPEECMLESAKVGDFVWSAKYHAVAEVMKEWPINENNSALCYDIYVFEPSETKRRVGFYATQRIEDLGSLEHLKKYISIDRLTN
jgi:hypothetical protein